MKVENTGGVILLTLKKIFVGISTALIIFTGSPQSFAEEVEIFGGEFDTEKNKPAPKVETPAEKVVTPPAQEVVVTPPKEVTTPPAQEVVVTPPQENVTPPAQEEILTPPEKVVTPPAQEVVITPPKEVTTPPQEVVVTPPKEVTTPPAQEIVVTPSAEVTTPPAQEVVVTPPAEVVKPFEQNNNGNGENNSSNGTVTVITPEENNNSSTRTTSTPQTNLKTLKQRFVKIALDENYTYYLDKQSVVWKKMPYSTSEYIADVWIRMIERNADTSDLPEDLADYLNDTSSDEITLAKDRGYQYMPEDKKVLQHKRYFLEHYYLRPKTEQIQFLCELEVVGHPQNTSSQRKYDYQNWEDLIPGSIESILYRSIIQVIGTSKASERGHMTFIDMVEEYARISMR